MLVGGLLLGACAHVDPLVVTGQAIVTAGKSFEGTAAVMDSLYRTGTLTEDQYSAWRHFVARWHASFHATRMLYDAASSGGDESTSQLAASILSSFIKELGKFEDLVAQVLHPTSADGGAL